MPKISALPTVSSPLISDVVPVVSGGSTGKVTLAAIGALFPAPIGSTQIDFDTKALAAAATIPASVSTLRLRGYYAAGDGVDDLFTRNSVAHTISQASFQSVDGAWWWVTPNPNGAYNAKAFGLRADGITDDTTIAQAVINMLARRGGSVTSTAAIEWPNGSILHTKPLIVAGDTSKSMLFKGIGTPTGGIASGTVFKWGGTKGISQFIIYAANETRLEGFSVDPSGGTGIVNLFHVVSDNIANLSTTLSAGVSAGTDITASVVNIKQIVAGSCLGIGYGTDNFEIVYVKSISGNTFVADFLNAHNSGAAVGGSGGGSSGVRFKDISGYFPILATTFNGGISAGSNVVTTPASMSGLDVGMEVVCGAGSTMEVVRIRSKTSTTFRADFAYNHSNGEKITSASCGILWGNVSATDTMQVSEGHMDNVLFKFTYAGGTTNGDSYAGIRIIKGGNVKNFYGTHIEIGGTKRGISIEAGSGTYQFDHPNFGNITESEIFHSGGGSLLVSSAECESNANHRFLTGGGTRLSAVLENNSWQCTTPADNYGIDYTGNLVLLSNEFYNFGGGVFKVRSGDLTGYGGQSVFNASRVTSIGNYYDNASYNTGIFYDGSNNCANVGDTATLNLHNRLVSIGDYGLSGLIAPIHGQIRILSASASTEFADAALTHDATGYGNVTYHSYIIPYTAFQTAGLTKDLRTIGLQPRTQVVSVYADTTTAFAGTAGTLNLRVGTTAGGSQLIVDHDVKSSTVTKGLLDADLGTNINRAGAIQGGYIPSWGGGDVYVRLTSGSGNLSGLTNGSVKIYVGVRRFA